MKTGTSTSLSDRFFYFIKLSVGTRSIASPRIILFSYIHPMNKIEHIGIAVRNLEEAILIYTELLGTECYKTEAVESEGVKTAFFQVGDSKIELLEASNEASPIAKFIEKKGEGIHHIAFDVTDIKQSMEELASKGFQLLTEQPKNGADNKLVAFIHPKSSNGVLVELCQEKG